MEDSQFVTLEQAIKLRKLGFRDYCYQHYDAAGTLCDNYISIPSYDIICVSSLLKSFNNYKNITDKWDTPTLSQVQDWLIKVKGLVICPCPEAKFVKDKEDYKNSKFIHTGWVFDIFVITSDNRLTNNPNKKEKILYSSFNEALSAGINTCLEILEKT